MAFIDHSPYNYNSLELAKFVSGLIQNKMQENFPHYVLLNGNCDEKFD